MALRAVDVTAGFMLDVFNLNFKYTKNCYCMVTGIRQW